MTARFRLRPALPVLFLVLPALARAQDTTRVRADSAARDSAAIRADSAAIRAETAGLQAPRVRVPPPIQPAWRFQLDFGFQDISGNRNLTVANSAFTAEHKLQDRFILNFKLEGRYGRSNGSEAVNYQLARLRFDWRPRDVISPFLGLDVVRDPIRKVARRIQVGTGANLNVIRRDASRTLFSLGFVQDHQTFTAGTIPASSDDTRWMFRAATTRLLGQTTRIDAVARYQPSVHQVADYLASLEASLRVSLTRRMGLTTKYEFSRDSRPATAVSTDDRSLSAALSFSW